MGGVVYADILVLVNAIVGYFLLKCTAFLASRMEKTWRLCVAAFLAGFSALLLLLPPLAFWFVLCAKLLCGAGIVWVAFPLSGWRVFGKTCFWYVLCNALFGGVVAAAAYYGAGNLEYRNLSVYLYLSPVVLVVCIVAMYAVIQLGGLLFGKPKPKQQIGFSLWFQETAPPAEGMALLDTGMHLKDPITGKQAMLLSFPAVSSQLPKATVQALEAYFNTGELVEHIPPLWLIAVKTATGMRALPALCCVRLLLHTAPHATTLAAPLVVITSEIFADGSYEGILGAQWEAQTRGGMNVAHQETKRSEGV